MLEDRDYMRSSYQPRISVTVCLLILNAIVFIIEWATCGYPPRFDSNNYFALSLHGLQQGFVWQLITYQFMHANLLHILFNSWTIYIFGRQVEGTLGGKKFCYLYFSGGIIGGLVQMAGAYFWPGHFGTGVVGASASGMALVAAFATIYPEETITMFFYFFPITMRAKQFVWGIAALSVVCVIWPTSFLTAIMGANVANAAHLGGMLTGFLFIRLFIQGHWRLPTFNFNTPQRRPAPRQLAVKRAGKKAFWTPNSASRDEELSPAEYLQKEVDPILDKISAHGIQSLTAGERQILEKARSKMNQR